MPSLNQSAITTEYQDSPKKLKRVIEMDLTSSTDEHAIQRHFYESATLIPNGLSTSPSSNISIEPLKPSQGSTPHDRSIIEPDVDAETTHPKVVSNDPTPRQKTHIVHLSAIEHCMPRAYIRVCLAYRLPWNVDLNSVVEKLNGFARKLVDAKPYLAGFVVPAPDSKTRFGLSEIRFTDDDFLHFPNIEIRHLCCKEVPFTYSELDNMALPPSVVRPELVSALPVGTDDQLAPAFRMQANIVEGGLIVSVYLHHCIADGTGLSFLLTGAALSDEFAFDRHLKTNGLPTPSLNNRLAAFANRKTIVRQKLSWSEPNQISDRTLRYNTRGSISKNHNIAPAGRGCLVALCREKIENLEASLKSQVSDNFISPNDALQAFLWHHMTKARKPSLNDPSISHSKLLIPVNIRKKLKEPIPESFLGAAVDFATAELPMDDLISDSSTNDAMLAAIALEIRRAIDNVNEAYIRQMIAVSLVENPDIDVRDLMASNMSRTDGADMYITSWEKLGLYDATLEMGLGRPDWVRKPWSKDPGSCVIMPSDDRKPYLEVLVQMTEVDVERLLADEVFMSYVVRTID